MARSAVLAIFLIAIFSLQDQLEAMAVDKIKTFDDYKNEITLIESAFQNESKATEETLGNAHQNAHNNLTTELFINYTSMYREILSLIDNNSNNPRYGHGQEQLNIISDEEHKEYRKILDTINDCFKTAKENNALDMALTHKNAADLIESLRQSAENECRTVANPQVKCRPLNNKSSKTSFENYQNIVSQRKIYKAIYVSDAIACAKRTVDSWPKKVEEFRNQVIIVKNRLQ